MPFQGTLGFGGGVCRAGSFVVVVIIFVVVVSVASSQLSCGALTFGGSTF